MRNGQLVLVNCKIRSGAFSGERVFQLRMAGGEGDYIGIAPVDHCLDAHRNPLGRDQPPAEVEIDGFVEAFLIANGGDEARIELPDGEVICVPAGQVPYQREPDRGSKYVPVGS
jgi:hypothetical protein